MDRIVPCSAQGLVQKEGTVPYLNFRLRVPFADDRHVILEQRRVVTDLRRSQRDAAEQFCEPEIRQIHAYTIIAFITTA